MMNVIPLHSSPLSRPLVRRLVVAAAVIALGLAVGAAFAGERPTAVDPLPGDAPITTTNPAR